MPASSLQSRIQAFEALDASSNPPITYAVRRKPPPPRPSDALQSPTSPTAMSLASIPPLKPNASRSPSPMVLAKKPSLMDFEEISMFELPPPHASHTTSKQFGSPLINLTSPPKAPPLPPRKLSSQSLRSLASASSSTPSTPSLPPRLPPRVASSPARSLNTLAPDHSYPPVNAAKPTRHTHASSTSSFHSVSLSSEGGRDSLDGSFETVSSSAPTSVSSNGGAAKVPPAVPQRTWQLPTAPPSPVSTLPPSRRPAPPPPTFRSKVATPPEKPASRRTPLPPAARVRYDALFARNVQHIRTLNPRKPRASGWRGISVDWTTTEGDPLGVGGDIDSERLDGQVVKLLWSCSKLNKVILREIWNECDPEHKGSLDRESFAQGMWRIDEELAKAARRTVPRSSFR